MKGIELSVSDGKVAKAVRSSIIISNKEGILRLLFIGNGDNPNISNIWYSKDLQLGDKFRIRYCDIDESELSFPEYTVDYDNTEEMDAQLLEDYTKLRKELIEEGVL